MQKYMAISAESNCIPILDSFSYTLSGIASSITIIKGLRMMKDKSFKYIVSTYLTMTYTFNKLISLSQVKLVTSNQRSSLLLFLPSPTTRCKIFSVTFRRAFIPNWSFTSNFLIVPMLICQVLLSVFVWHIYIIHKFIHPVKARAAIRRE